MAVKLEILTEEQIVQIDSAAKRILATIGVVVPHELMLQLFAKAGAQVEHHSGRVRIPEALIDQCLASSAKTFTLFGRDRQRKAEFGTGKRNYNSSAGQAHWIEPTGKRRTATLADVVTATKFAEVLPQLTIAGAMADPSELDVSFRCVEVVAAQLRHTTKPLTFWFYDRASAAYVVEVLVAVSGSEKTLASHPITYAFLEPISPLRFDTNGIDLLFETCKIPLPVSIGPMAQTGLSAPSTLAGTLAQETAEVLAGVCVVELIRPGVPTCFGCICHAFDMKTTQIIFGGPEQALMSVAATQIGKYYQLPVYTNSGLTDSKTSDAQAGLEIAGTIIPAALAGCDIFGHFGIAGADQGASLEVLLLQHEAIAYLERIMRGITVNADKLALDVIEQVGPGGTFIDQMHTAQHFREEIWIPGILDRAFWSVWESAGRPSLADKIAERVPELLASYEAQPLDDDVDREVKKIINEAKQRLVR